MKKAIAFFVVLGFFLNVSDAVTSTCKTWQYYHGTFCQEDENNVADELLHHDRWGISNKYTFQKYVFCPADTMVQLSYSTPVGNWELDPSNIDDVTVCGRDYYTYDAETEYNLRLRVCYIEFDYGYQDCGSWYELTSTYDDQCVSLSLPDGYLYSDSQVFIEAWIPPKNGSAYSYVRSYSIEGDVSCI